MQNNTPKVRTVRRPKIDKESLKLVLVLAVIALIASLLLSVVYKFTEAKIDYEARLIAKFNESYVSTSYKAVSLDVDKSHAFTEIKSAYRADDGAVLINSKSNKAYNSAGIELIVIIKDGEIIKVIKNFAAETPGLGSKALAQTHLDKYVGLKVSDFSFDVNISAPNEGENKSQVACVTGATKSSTGVQYAIEAAVLFYKQIG